MKASPIRCLVTAGPTREFFDPVRFLSNPSSGKMGYALAEAAVHRGWDVELISGPVSLPVPEGVRVNHVVTGQEMFEEVSKRFPGCDVLIMTAAIMDYRPKMVADHKIKKYELEMVIEMEPVIDVLATVGRDKDHQLVVGFAAETNDLVGNATKKLHSKNADFVVGNIIGGEEGAFGRDDNRVVVISHNNDPIELGPMSKSELATALLDLFTPELNTLVTDDTGSAK
jgi:phosphopantothenoylcysteine decarboxylase/phosphopantothenate--cysteine ligase